MLPRLRPALLTLALALSTLAAGAVGTSGAASAAQQRADDFVIASFNVLGANHTDGRHGRGGFEKSPVRLRNAIKVLRRTHVDVVGLQEFQRSQYEQFVATVGDRWGVFAGAAWDTENSIAWRLDRFELVEGWGVSVPYFNGNLRQMPVVALRSLDTGRVIYVMNTHNPADTRGNAQQWRRQAVRIQRTVTRKLSNEQHAPVFMTGDMNDRAAYFCPFTRNGVMHSFVGGAHRKGGECDPPAWSGVDWIFGNRYVDFDSPRIDRSALVEATTDHPVISAHVTLRS